MSRQAPLRRRFRWFTLLPMAAFMVVAALVFAPEGWLSCADPGREVSPDGAWTITLCARPMWIAMPGQGGDAPGWVVLRDSTGAIRGVSGLSLVDEYHIEGDPTRWQAGRVEVPLIAQFSLVPAGNGLMRWLDDRVWRLRALFGMTTTDAMFR